MKAQVTVKVINEVRSGMSQSTGNEWRTQDIVVGWTEQTADGRTFEQLVLCTLHGQSVVNFAALNPQPGSVIEGDLRFSTRSYNNRVYNDISLVL